MLYEYRKQDERKQEHLELALILGDSVKYPYDNIKFRVAYFYPPRSNERYAQAYETLYDAMEYFKKNNDDISVARVGVYMSNLLREARLYSEAKTLMNQSVEIYRNHGLNEYVVKSQLNYANILSETDRDSAVYILQQLLENPVSKTDFLFYNTLFRNYYLLTGDVSYIFEAYRQIAPLEGYTNEKGLYLAKIADYYLNSTPKMTDSALLYINRALEYTDSMDVDEYKLSIYRTAHGVYESDGQQLKAYNFLKSYSSLIEERSLRYVTMAKVDKKGTIRNINKALKYRDYQESLKIILIVSISSILFLVFCLGVYKRIKSLKSNSISAESECNRRGLQLEGLAIDLEEKEHMLSQIGKK